MSVKPPIWWYQSMDEYYARKKIKEDPEINNIFEDKPQEFEAFTQWYIAYSSAYGSVGFITAIYEWLTNGWDSIPKDRMRMIEYDPEGWKELSKAVFERDNYTCAYCGEIGGQLEVDHKRPWSRGGTDDMDNLTTACLRCNRQKHDKTVEEFMEWKKNKISGDK